MLTWSAATRYYLEWLIYKPVSFLRVPLPITRRHSYKMYRKHSSSTVRAKFFSERIVSVWNNLPDIVEFSTLTSFIRTIKTVDLAEHLRYC